jgi:thiopeptide-type bacteriocin biosynthesis protein
MGAPPRWPSNPLLPQVVLAALRSPGRRPVAASKLGLDSEALQRAVEVFVNAGTRALQEKVAAPAWVAWELRLRPGLERSPFAGALLGAWARWRSRGVVSRMSFLRKPPGLRLRFEARDRRRAREEIQGWLARQASVEAFAPAVYDPESYQFGGERGMDIAHAHFHADSLGALQILERKRRGKLIAGVEVLSALCVFDLVSRTAGDAWEAWDLWRGLELTGRTFKSSPGVPEAFARAVRPWIEHPRSILTAISPWERQLVKRCQKLNAAAAGALLAAACRGELLFSPRQILPFWIHLHWNRWGISPRAQVVLTLGAERVWSPKGVRA